MPNLIRQTQAQQTLGEHKQIYAYGFKRYWQKSLRQFLPNHAITFVFLFEEIPNGAVSIIWGAQDIPSKHAERLRWLRVEDGFVRSIGLGAEFARPMSWVFDSQGLYFNCTQPSDLESVLLTLELDEQERLRAQNLIQLLSESTISKYNLPSVRNETEAASIRRIHQARSNGKKVHLVVGQVESDASIRLGSEQIKSNFELLQHVRTQFPEDLIVYKPHPDVVAGARAQGEGEKHATMIADETIVQANITELFQQIDALHCMSSLAGFEALLRGIPVHCYGMPFYAGWGLTQDFYSHSRRVRKLDLETLVFGALIVYPTYVHPQSGHVCSVEDATQGLLTQKELQNKSMRKLYQFANQRFKRLVRQILNATRGGAR
ncbi:MAG: capsular polysaccharide export protein KpsC [Idiomarinaceae bacterium HL-53]|nr:MAG: capsular polysaccharide export protein KpsC [Idiomarinaceae bacterium HL-53]CUS47122.1 capsular polysaccharide export protein [Idiomarinaceae bacterium HL-53]